MRVSYFLRPQADRDIDELADYLSREAGLDIGLLFLSEIYETFHLLASQPEMGWSCRLRPLQLINARTFPVSARFDKYLIFYQALPERIDILRVLHGAQDLLALLERRGID